MGEKISDFERPDLTLYDEVRNALLADNSHSFQHEVFLDKPIQHLDLVDIA